MQLGTTTVEANTILSSVLAVRMAQALLPESVLLATKEGSEKKVKEALTWRPIFLHQGPFSSFCNSGDILFHARKSGKIF